MAGFTWISYGAQFRKIKNFMQLELYVDGALHATGTTYSYPYSSNQLLGTKFKIVSGYEGTNSVMLEEFHRS